MQVLLLLLVAAFYVNCDLEYANVNSVQTPPENNNLTKICSENVKIFTDVFFNQIDTNRDDSIGKLELHDAFLKQVKKSHESEILEELERIDFIKGNERIGFEEYARATFESYEDLEAGKLMGSEFGEMRNLYEREKKKWYFISGKVLAKNELSDATLNRVQLYEFIYSDEFPHVHEYELGITFNQFDINSDGFLDVNEFIEAIKILDETLVDFKLRKFSQLLDLNADNLLDRYEFQLWFNPSSEQKVNDEIKFMLEACDADSDEALNRSEITKNCDVFIRSQLTDFGRMFSNISEKTETEKKQEL